MAFNVNEPRDDHGRWTAMGHSTKNVAKKVAKATETHNKPMTDAESIAKTGRDLAWHRANDVRRLQNEHGMSYGAAVNPANSDRLLSKTATNKIARDRNRRQ